MLSAPVAESAHIYKLPQQEQDPVYHNQTIAREEAIQDTLLVKDSAIQGVAKAKKLLAQHRDYKAVTREEFDLLMEIYDNSIQRLDCIAGGGFFTDTYRQLDLTKDSLIDQYNTQYQPIIHQDPLYCTISVQNPQTKLIPLTLYAKPLMPDKQYTNIIPIYDHKGHYVGEKRQYINLQTTQTMYEARYFNKLEDTIQSGQTDIDRVYIPKLAKWKSIPKKK